jgi:Sarcosine oxidase A3 domain
MTATPDAGLNPAMAWDRLEPPARAGDVAQRRPLTVHPLRRLAVEELLVVDDDLPQADGATVFWLQPDGAGSGWVAWAATLDGAVAVPWLVRAMRLRLRHPDPVLLRLVAEAPGAIAAEGPARAVEPMPRQLACICREKSLESLYRAAEAGWTTTEQVKRRTGAIFGECQGRRCESVIARRLDLEPVDPRARISPRPPLVPVPASVLAAFGRAAEGGQRSFPRTEPAP